MAYNGRYTTGLRLLYLRDFFLANANKTHCVKPKEIKEFLKTKGYESIDRKTLYNDIATLLGPDFDLRIRYDFQAGGYFLDNPPFDPTELQLIIDSLNASKFITNQQVRDITVKVQKLADKHTQGSLNRRAVVADRIKDKNESVMKYADRIHTAIEQDRKISFRYFHYSPDKNKEKNYSKSGERYTVSPFALVWNNGNYYLYAYNSEKNRFQYFRVDRMENITPLLDVREGKDLYREKDLTTKKAKVFDMYSGEEYNVRLRFHNRITHSVIDQFGKDIVIIPDDENHAIVNVPVEISPPFFAWVATFGRSIKILGPEPVVEEMKKFLEKSMDMYKNEGKM